VGHGQESRAASSLATRAAGAKPADGIFANPAGRPDSPGGQSCIVAAPARNQPMAGRPAADGSHRKCRELIPLERERSERVPCRIRRSGELHSERGPGLLRPGQSMHGQNIQAMGAMRTEVAGVSTVSELWPDVWWVLA
jgi:hypothetical protein